MRQRFLIMICLMALSYSGIAQDWEKLFIKTDKIFTKYIPPENPGAAVVVIKDGEVVHKSAYGLANLEHKVPITTSSVFDIASVSKQFVGYSVAKLIIDKKLSLKDEIQTYIPELPDFGHQITVGHLLYHQSGLRDWPGTMKLGGVDFDDVLTFEQIIEMVYRQQDLNFTPGSKYVYSNTGYNVLVEVIQRITKKPFREWTKENIFNPLGMKDTFFKDQYNEFVPNAVSSYFKDDGKIYKSSNNLTALGSSSMQTTIDDMTKWLLHLDSQEAQNYVSLMQTTGVLTSGEETNYAYGLEIDTYSGLKRLHHSGEWASFTSYLAYLPDQHFSVAVLMNYDSWPEGFAQEVIDTYLKNEFTKESSSTGPFDEEKPKIPKNLNLDLEKYTGTYFLEKYMVYLNITLEKGKLYSQATGENKQVMQPVSDTRFWVKSYDASIYFNLNDQGDVESITYHKSLCKKKEPIQSNDKESLNAYAGWYHSAELNTSYQVKYEDEQFYIAHVSNGKVPLKRVWNDGFETDAFYMPLVDFQRDDKGTIVSLTASQYRSRNIKFNKMQSPN